MVSKEFIFRSLYVQEKCKNIYITSHYKKLALYGAGKHTKWLLETLSEVGYLKKIKFILDDNPTTENINGIPVILTKNCPDDIKLIIPSSDIYESKMAKRILELFPDKEVITLYNKAGSGPFESKFIDTKKANISWQKSQLRLAQFHNIHQGKRCFILGNGPSLNDTDLTKLKNEYTFGTNRIYLLFSKLGFETSYYLSVNKNISEQWSEDILKIQNPKFLSLESSKYYSPNLDKLVYLPHENSGKPAFHTDLTEGIWWGATVTYVAMQVAYFMGFEEVNLIGVDHHFKTKGQAHKLIQNNEDDKNHFDPNYFKGKKWQLPDLDTSELAYRMADFTYKNSGRIIRDATVNGHLNIFEKVDYLSLFK